jgi:hypothetical protein
MRREWSPGCPCVLGRLLRIFLRNFEWDAARKCPQLIRNANLLWLHPFILLGRAILSTLPGATDSGAYCPVEIS